MLKTKLCKVCGEPIKINWPSTALHKKCAAYKEQKFQRNYYFNVTKKKRKLNKIENNLLPNPATGTSSAVDINKSFVK